MSNAEQTSSASAEATSKVSPDMPHVEASASAGNGGSDIPHDREPEEIKGSNATKYLKAAIMLMLIITTLVLGFLLGKRLFGGRSVIVAADEAVSNFAFKDVGEWFKSAGTKIASGFTAAVSWFKGLFSRGTSVPAETATAAA